MLLTNYVSNLNGPKTDSRNKQWQCEKMLGTSLVLVQADWVCLFVFPDIQAVLAHRKSGSSSFLSRFSTAGSATVALDLNEYAADVPKSCKTLSGSWCS